MLHIFIFIIVMKGTEGYLNVIYIYIHYCDEGYLNNFCSLVQRLFDKVSLLI